MKFRNVLIFFIPLFLWGCNQPSRENREFAAVSQVETGKAISVMVTAYSTTLIANGADQTRLRIAVIDSLSREITTAGDSLRVFITGDGSVKNPDGTSPVIKTDTGGKVYAACKLDKGICHLVFVAGKKPDKIKLEVKSGKLWPGGHEIHTLPVGFVMMEPRGEQLPVTTKPIDRMIGADISFLPQIEAKGTKFKENGVETDAINLLKKHGFNYIRLRIFVEPANEKGYAPGEGFCDLNHTLAMAKRIKEAGMKLLLDFHYSNYWADPQQQFKPLAWSSLGFEALRDTVRSYTIRVLSALKNQGTPPDMVQVGNEINHGILWPDGHISNPDNLAALLKAGVEGVETVAPATPVMMHLALGGQNDEARFWLNNMIARGVRFDIIGISFYPRWHGTLEDLKSNLGDLCKRYHKPVNVAEYSDFKKQVHDIVFGLPDGQGKGACIWEPLNAWSGLFDRENNVKPLMLTYDSLARQYLR